MWFTVAKASVGTTRVARREDKGFESGVPCVIGRNMARVVTGTDVRTMPDQEGSELRRFKLARDMKTCLPVFHVPLVDVTATMKKVTQTRNVVIKAGLQNG